MNQVILTARIEEASALRYTPAGIPALDLRLAHESRLQEAGESRQVMLTVRALALGALAESIGRQPLGSQWRFTGFLATPRRGKQVVFHVQEFQQD